jgi:hypothetical protein
MSRAVLAALLLLLALPSPAAAIPAYARRYKVSCQLCHNPVPALNDFGNQFAGNGYRMAAGEEPRDTINTGDPLLFLSNSVPLAIRVDAYAQAFSKGQASTDFQTPWLMKLLASGPISKTFSYFMYVNLYERGEFGGFEDLFVYANDVWGSTIDAFVGQFQLSDPMFKREHRLMYEDYAVYRVKVGEEPANLTYDRGITASIEVLGFDLVGELVNGNGIDKATDERRFDDNGFKNYAGYLTRDLGRHLRLGAFGYYGETEADDTPMNKIRMWGGDGTVRFGLFTLNGQYIHREDDNPFFDGSGKVTTDGGFLEAMIRPTGSRFHGFALYNLVNADQPALRVGQGGPADVTRYETVTGGLGYLVLRNLRLTGEVSWDTQLEQSRWTLGFTTAF